MPERDYVWLPRENILTFEEIGFLVDLFASMGVDRVRITGGEPLLRKDLSDLVRLLSGLPSVSTPCVRTDSASSPASMPWTRCEMG